MRMLKITVNVVARRPRRKLPRTQGNLPDHEPFLNKRVKFLEATKRRLTRLYQFGKPDIRWMPSWKVTREWELLHSITGTTLMSRELFARWTKIHRAKSSNIACEMACPF